MTFTLRRFALAAAMALFAGAPAMLAPMPAQAQGLFAPAIKVNDKVITKFELDQRSLMLQLLRAPGDVRNLAREQLIDERLQTQAATAAGFEIDEVEIETGMEEFAGRSGMAAQDLIDVFASAGVAEQTFRDFVQAGLLWRRYVSQAFGPRVKITEAEIDRAISAITAGSDVRVLISEIVIPLTPENAQAATEIAEQISKLTTTQAFSQAAAQVSAAPSAQNGGQLDWTPLTQLPPQLRPVLLALAPGEVSEPLPLNGAIALFQLRDVQETGVTQPSYAAIDYATYRLPGGRSAETLAQAAQIATQVATCDDLFAVGRTTPPEWLSRQSAAPGEIASDIALELAKLDAGELSYSLTRNNGQDLLLVMLCGRTPAVDIETDRQAVLSSLRNQRLASYAKSYLAQMRADAVIVSQ